MAKKKAVGKQGRKAGVNRSKAIRDYLGAHSTATNQEVKQALAEQGIEVSDTLVSNARKSAGMPLKKRRRRKLTKRGPGRPSVAGPGNGKVAVEDLMAARKFIAQVGGIDEAKRLVDVMAKVGEVLG